MSNADIAELLTVSYTSYYFKCQHDGENPIPCEEFCERYKYYIQDFRHLLNVDTGDRELNG